MLVIRALFLVNSWSELKHWKKMRRWWRKENNPLPTTTCFWVSQKHRCRRIRLYPPRRSRRLLAYLQKPQLWVNGTICAALRRTSSSDVLSRLAPALLITILDASKLRVKTLRPAVVLVG